MTSVFRVSTDTFKNFDQLYDPFLSPLMTISKLFFLFSEFRSSSISLLSISICPIQPTKHKFKKREKIIEREWKGESCRRLRAVSQARQQHPTVKILIINFIFQYLFSLYFTFFSCKYVIKICYNKLNSSSNNKFK